MQIDSDIRTKDGIAKNSNNLQMNQDDVNIDLKHDKIHSDKNKSKNVSPLIPMDGISKSNTMDRRKRINRMKTIIVLIVIILLLLPTVLCIILGLQVSRLQKQVNQLSALHNQYETTETNHVKYAYAAVKEIEDENENRQKDMLSNEKQEDLQQVYGDSKDAILSKNNNQDNSKDNKATSNDPKEGIYSGKKVYLTFDDGPSIYTADILDILSKYNIKATFFVVGKTDSDSLELYKRIVNEGHVLGMHSYSHKYDTIYNSVEDFDKDFTKLQKLLYDTTGYKPSIYRFPGGSANLVNEYGMDKFIHYLNKASVVYFDWNVENGDAKNINYTKDQLIENVLNGVAAKERSIVLMHDTLAKKTTAESLPGLIHALIDGGAQVLPLSKDVVPIQMIEADTVK